MGTVLTTVPPAPPDGRFVCFHVVTLENDAGSEHGVHLSFHIRGLGFFG